jgi:phosphoserine phosphatase
VTAFASVVIDVDSTLCGVEGIDFLAERRGPEISSQIVALTDRAMKGDIALESIYGHRLTVIQPTRADISALATAYERSVAPDAAESIEAMRRADVRLILVSGGIREAILGIARRLGFAEQDVHAVSLRFDDRGNYAGFDEKSPLTNQLGKPELVGRLIASGRLPRPVLALGDGMTDAKLVGTVDTFAVYTGFARRASVAALAALEIPSFSALERAVLGARG